MSWGSLLETMGGTGNLLSIGSTIMDKMEADNNAKKAGKAYYASLATQQKLAKAAAATAQQRAAWESAMKERVLAQTGSLGATLREAQAGLGAMPLIDQAAINRDYSATKQTMMGDFENMLRLVESQGRSNQMERLGGAGSTAADSSRINALMKQYSGELQKIDDAAYDSAVSRASNTQNLINTNRQNTLSEITGIYNAQLNPEMQLLQGNDISNLMNTYANYANNMSSAKNEAEKTAGIQDANLGKMLGQMLGQTYNNTTPATPGSTVTYKDGTTIKWN